MTAWKYSSLHVLGPLLLAQNVHGRCANAVLQGALQVCKLLILITIASKPALHISYTVRWANIPLLRTRLQAMSTTSILLCRANTSGVS